MAYCCAAACWAAYSRAAAWWAAWSAAYCWAAACCATRSAWDRAWAIVALLAMQALGEPAQQDVDEQGDDEVEDGGEQQRGVEHRGVTDRLGGEDPAERAHGALGAAVHPLDEAGFGVGSGEAQEERQRELDRRQQHDGVDDPDDRSPDLQERRDGRALGRFGALLVLCDRRVDRVGSSSWTYLRAPAITRRDRRSAGSTATAAAAPAPAARRTRTARCCRSARRSRRRRPSPARSPGRG